VPRLPVEFFGRNAVSIFWRSPSAELPYGVRNGTIFAGGSRFVIRADQGVRLLMSFQFPYPRALLAVPIALCIAATPSLAQVDFHFGIEVAPPAPPVEVVPPPQPGFVWAPGYWEWDGDRHVWVPGHWMAVRPGYYWVPDRWEHHVEERGSHWHFAPGQWERDHGHWDRDRGRQEHERREHREHERD